MRIVPDTNCLIYIGAISKVHGINGEVLVVTNKVIDEQILETELVFIIIDGLPVPFFVSECQDRNDTTLQIKIDEIDSRNLAEELVGCEVMIEEIRKAGRKKKIFSPSSIIGYTVIDETHGNIGIVKSIQNYQSNSVMQLLHQKIEILIPIHEDIIGEINDDKKTIYIQAPEGLIDLYLGE